jgi:hypothetical protein
MKYSVTYDQTIGHEAFEFPAIDVETAIAMVKEVIGDHIVISHASVVDGEGVVQYEETVTHEAVVSAESEGEARKKVLVIVPDANITNSWVLKENLGVSDRVILTETDTGGVEITDELTEDTVVD